MFLWVLQLFPLPASRRTFTSRLRGREKNRIRKTFPSPIFLAGLISSHKLAQLGQQTSFLYVKGFEVFRWKEITFTISLNHNILPFSFLKALDEQEVTLKQQIVHLEKQVKERTPDKAKLKELQDAVKKHEKGKKY